MNCIENIVEPEHLFLAWQSPSDTDRTRRIVGELTQSHEGVVLQYLTETTDFRAATKAGFVGYPAFKLRSLAYKTQVMEVLNRRLPPRSRSDFGSFLAKFRLPQESNLSDFALLGYTEARLPGDGFSIVNDFFGAKPPFEFVTELTGFRHYDGMQMKIANFVGRKVDLVPEPNNKHDKNAISVELDGKQVGYINRVQAPNLRQWISCHDVVVAVDRIDGTTDKPRVYLFLKVKPRLDMLAN